MISRLSYLTVLSVLVCALFMTSCAEESEKTNEEARQSVTATDNQTDAANASQEVNNKSANASAKPAGPKTSMSFEESTYDFGQVKSGEKVTHNYSFTNTGDEPLLLSNVKASCGCTAPNWPRTPIAPGETGEIEVVFSARGKGKQKKNVTITANTQPATTQIFLEAEVLPKDSK